MLYKDMINEGFFDRFKKKKRQEKQKQEKKTTISSYTLPEPLSKDSEEYKDRESQYKEVINTVSKVINKYKPKYGGFGIYKESDYYEDYLSGYDDSIEIVVGSISDMDGYDKIKDLPESQYREEVGKLSSIVDTVANEAIKAVEANKKIKGTVTADGDKLDWCLYFNYKSSVNESVIFEAVENEITSAGSKEGLMKKFHITNNDINVGKRFLSKNPKIAAKFKACKSIKDFMMVMKDKEVKQAMDNDK